MAALSQISWKYADHQRRATIADAEKNGRDPATDPTCVAMQAAYDALPWAITALGVEDAHIELVWHWPQRANFVGTGTVNGRPIFFKVTAEPMSYGEFHFLDAAGRAAWATGRHSPMIKVFDFAAREADTTNGQPRIECFTMEHCQLDLFESIYQHGDRNRRIPFFDATVDSIMQMGALDLTTFDIDEAELELAAKTVADRLRPAFEAILPSVRRFNILTEPQINNYLTFLDSLGRVDETSLITGDASPVNAFGLRRGWQPPVAPGEKPAPPQDAIVKPVVLFDNKGLNVGPIESDVAQAAVNFGDIESYQEFADRALERYPEDLDGSRLERFGAGFAVMSGGYRVGALDEVALRLDKIEVDLDKSRRELDKIASALGDRDPDAAEQRRIGDLRTQLSGLETQRDEAHKVADKVVTEVRRWFAPAMELGAFEPPRQVEVGVGTARGSGPATSSAPGEGSLAV